MVHIREKIAATGSGNEDKVRKLQPGKSPKGIPFGSERKYPNTPLGVF
jgi:hypothetical protein